MTKQFSLQSLLATLVAFKTLPHDHQENRRAITWITSQLRGLPLHIETVERNGFPALLITTAATKTPRIWLQAHLDVVPGSDRAFAAQVKNGRLIGRGAFDMKFAIAAYMKLLNELGDSLPAYDFGIMITTDEEIGGANGVKALLDDGYASEAVLLPDGGKNWQFVSASRGILHARFTAEGQANHGSRPWLGVNAIGRLTGFLTKLQGLFPEEPCTTPNHFHDSLNIGTIRGGEAVNQIPASATAGCDIRYVPEHKDQLLKAIHTLLGRCEGVSMEVLAEGSGYRVDQESPYFKAFTAILKERGVEPAFEITHGSSDARYFAARNIPAIVFRPVGEGHHSENEWIDLAELDRFYTVLAQFVRTTTATDGQNR